MARVIQRMQDDRSARNRLAALLSANQAIIGDLDLSAVLRRIVEAARELLHARYGALGVIGPGGTGLEQFVHTGIDSDTVRLIGHPPEGKGLLGALIDDPQPIRLAEISQDVRSVGFPPNHPPMSSFLGVPIRVRDEVYGNLYLAERESGEFTAEDAELAAALAATAAVAIENARLYEQSRRRQRWLQMSTEVTRRLLSLEGEHPLELIARSLLEMAEADVVSVALPSPDTGLLTVEVAAGVQAEHLRGMTFPTERTLSAMAIRTGTPLLLNNVARQTDYHVHLTEVLDVNAVMALPLVGSRSTYGALLVGRATGGKPFSADDLEMATTYATHAAVALELAEARADRQRMILLEDRDRIARDLHDHVIQRLFAAGLSVQSLQAAVSPQHGERLHRIVSDLDDTIRQIRHTIFQLRRSGPAGTEPVRSAVLDVIAALSPLLGFEPRVQFSGAIDILVDGDLKDDIIAVVREALTNIARHARATAAEVTLDAHAGWLSVVVADDGVGLGGSERRSGLANLRERAEQRGGSLTIDSADALARSGVALSWRVPLNR